MKHIKLFTALLTVALIAGVTIFYACKKEDIVQNTTAPELKDKIEYMKIPCVNFSRIKKTENLSKGETMLQFDSWEHYAEVIDAMLDFSYTYFDKRVKEILRDNPDLDEDELSEFLQREGIYQFMPLYSFDKELQFENSAFEKLRKEELQWMQNTRLSNADNPFDEMGLGYIQSALHNTEGKVMIGGQIYTQNKKDDGGGGTPPPPPPCRKTNDINLKTINNNVWPMYYYNNKWREVRGYLTTDLTHSYAKTSVYYIDRNDNYIVWCCNIGVILGGHRNTECSNNSSAHCEFYKEGSIYASVCEKYCWYNSSTSYLDQNYYILNNVIHNAIVYGKYIAPEAPEVYELGL